jgi:hypothetical protein
MIGPGTGVRVYLAAGVTDMRNYVESTIMRSLHRLGSGKTLANRSLAERSRSSTAHN